MKRRVCIWLCFSSLFVSCLTAASGSPVPTFGSPAEPGDSLAPSSQAVPEAVQGVTYYVRMDGGDTAQCTGLADAPYPGSGTGQPCAWNHPFQALPPYGTARIASGDTLIIGAGNYRMGYGASGAEACDATASYECVMPPIPSGPSPTNPTRILGRGWESGCANPPQLWGTERADYIINLTDASNVEVGCMEITDHSGCIESHSGTLECERDTSPYGEWAVFGVYAEDSSSVYLHDLNIHGLAHGGVLAGRLTNWALEDVRIAANGWVGWDGDLWDSGSDSNSGDMIFRRVTVEWNGCGETFPDLQLGGCWGQIAGGYGDGVATGHSGGHWLVEDSIIRHNTSDGLDFLYIDEVDSSITIRRTLSAGNAGNQVKTFRGPFLIENSILIGNCGFFHDSPFIWVEDFDGDNNPDDSVDNCRALGTALEIGVTAGDQVTVINNTLTSEGDCLVVAECTDSCDGTEQVLLRNNLFQGQVDFLQPFENTCLVYQETFPDDPFDVDYSVINGVKNDACPGVHDLCSVALGVVNSNVDTFDAHLLPDSPAINAGLASMAPTVDFDGYSRDAQPDIGAYEFGALPPPVSRFYLPLMQRH